MKKHSTRFIGLDTHKNSIAGAKATEARTEPGGWADACILVKQGDALRVEIPFVEN